MRQRGMCFDYPWRLRNATVIMLSNMFYLVIPAYFKLHVRWFSSLTHFLQLEYLGCIFNAFRKINGQTIKNAIPG